MCASYQPLGAHRLVGVKQIVPLTRGVPQPTLEIQVVVTVVHPTRPREWLPDQTVMDIVGTDVISKQPVHIFFHDAWASGASFMNVGDEVSLRGFVVHDVPRTHDVPAGVTPVMPATGAEYYLMPIEGLSSELAVVQPGEQGDWMEIIVRPSNFDNPTVRCKKGRNTMGSQPQQAGPSTAKTYVSGNGKALPERDAPE